MPARSNIAAATTRSSDAESSSARTSHAERRRRGCHRPWKLAATTPAPVPPELDRFPAAYGISIAITPLVPTSSAETAATVIAANAVASADRRERETATALSR